MPLIGTVKTLLKSSTPKAKKHKGLLITVSAVLVFAVCCVALGFITSTYCLKITEYEVTDEKISRDINIAVLTDLHTHSFGNENQRLLEMLKSRKPDLIFTVGDTVNKDSEDISFLSPLYKALSEIAPTYCSLGNHEISNSRLEEIKKLMSENAVLLDNEYTHITVNGTKLRVGGIMGYLPDDDKLNEFVKDFADTEDFTVMLMHCPEYYIWGLKNAGIDLFLCGHTHGGQVILPFIGGLYAPEQGYLPYYDYGIFHEESSVMIISRGLGSSLQPVRRFNNIPEILYVTLSPEVSHE